MHLFYPTLRRLVWASVIIFIALGGRAQGSQVVFGQTLVGDKPVTRTMEEILRYAEQASIQRQSEGPRKKIREELEVERNKKPLQGAQELSSFPKTGAAAVIAQQNTQTPHSNFAALQAYETANVTITPPDCMGDVGPTQVCIASNNRIKWYPKNTVCEPARTTSTSSGSLAASGSTYSVYIEEFFNDVKFGSEVTDPHVQYDRLSQRWFIVAINTAASSNRIMIAVSNGPTITDKTSFTFYQFQHDQGTAPASTDYQNFCDYPTFGVDKNALYVGGLIFDADLGTFIGTSVYVIRKSALLAGGPPVFTAFRNVGTDATGIFCAQGVQNDDPAATQGYFVGVNMEVFSRLNYIVVNDPGGTPSITQGTIDVPSTSYPDNVDASGSTAPLDGIDDRLLNAMLVTNKITGAKSIWTAHNIGVTAAGTASLSSADRNAVRWYRLAVNGSTIALSQSGTMFDPTGSARSYWMGSVAASGQEHAIVGASVAGPSAFANVAAAGRYATTPAGSLFSPSQITSYSDTYNFETSGFQRWGDYSQTVVDPSDNMTIWTFQEFVSGTDRWAVRATQFKAPPPAPVSNMTPITCTADRTIDVIVNGNAGANFAGYFDPGDDVGGPGFEKRLAITSTGGVTISNVVLNTATQVQFKLNYAAATLGSTQTLTITNPDCQSVTFQYTLPSGCSVVPVKWVSIDAVWNGPQAQVNWKVANEINLKHYEVERSSDGINFSTLSIVAANNAESASYSYTDLNPGANNYYRVRQVDRDGKFGFSAIAALSKQAITRMSIYPNPGKGQVQLSFPAAKGSFRVVDANGKVVYSTIVGGNTLFLNTEAWARGIYVAEFADDNGKVEREKLVLQ